MKVSGLTRAGNEVRFDVVGAHSSYSTWFRFAGPYELDLSGSPALTAGLIPALVARESLHVAGPVDTKLLENAAAAQDVLCAWEYDRHPRYPRFSPVPVNTGNPAAQRSGGDADEGGGRMLLLGRARFVLQRSEAPRRAERACVRDWVRHHAR